MTMEFVAQKLGFLKCSEPNSQGAKKRPSEAATLDCEDAPTKRRKLSNEESSSSDSPNSRDLSFDKLNIASSSDEQPGVRPPNRSFVSIPTPVRPVPTSRSLLNPQQFKWAAMHSFLPTSGSLQAGQASDKVQLDSLTLYPPANYMSFMFTPYGLPSNHLIGPLTPDQRREKVERYLEKKKNRQWQNVKYSVRQSLADNRKRVQGKFVKAERKWKWNELPPQQPIKKEEVTSPPS